MRASVKGRPGVYYVKKIRSYVQNSDHGSHEDFQFFKCMPVTDDVHSLKYIPSFWCVNLAWSYVQSTQCGSTAVQILQSPLTPQFFMSAILKPRGAVAVENKYLKMKIDCWFKNLKSVLRMVNKIM